MVGGDSAEVDSAEFQAGKGIAAVAVAVVGNALVAALVDDHGDDGEGDQLIGDGGESAVEIASRDRGFSWAAIVACFENECKDSCNRNRYESETGFPDRSAAPVDRDFPSTEGRFGYSLLLFHRLRHHPCLLLFRLHQLFRDAFRSPCAG